jgi:hypothetical protein
VCSTIGFITGIPALIAAAAIAASATFPLWLESTVIERMFARST